MTETTSLLSGKPMFPLGRTVATPGALDALDLAGVAPEALLDRHVHGDWGDLSEGDRETNGEALFAEGSLLLAYVLPDNMRIWIISEADRSATTLPLPAEY